MEIYNLMGQPHKHIVETLGAFRYGDTFSIIFPLAESNLEDYLLKEEPFPSAYLWEQMRGISDGLAYLHGLQDGDVDQRTRKELPKGSIVIAYHLDLKPANILIINGTMQIADFGLSKVNSQILRQRYQDSSSGWGNEGGYKAYAPPEYPRSGIKHYAGHDIWSLGAIFSEVATHDILLTDAKANRRKASVLQYRKNRQIEENHCHDCSVSFHNDSKLKKSVHDQHKLLLKATSDKGETDLWQSIFYQNRFCELVTQMLATDPTKRGTVFYVASTLDALLEETKEKQKNQLSGLKSPLRDVPTIWDEVRLGTLQSDCEKHEDAPFL